MKISTKWIATAATAVAIFFGSNVMAQQGASNPGDVWHLGVGVEGAIPTGTIRYGSNFMLGGTARLQYDTKSNVSLMLTSGYYNFFGKTGTATVISGTNLYSTSYKYPSVGLIPVKAGVKVFATQNLYFSGEAGAGFETGSTVNNTKLILSPGIGYANYQGLDLGLRYENFSGQSDNYGFVALRIAYGFKL